MLGWELVEGLQGSIGIGGMYSSREGSQGADAFGALKR